MLLITGANGFIGSRLKQAVRGPVRTQARTDADFPCDLAGIDNALFDALVAGVRSIVHLAARAHVLAERAADPIAMFRHANLAPTVALARAAARAGVPRFVYLSSIGVSVAPDEPYARSKWEAERSLAEIAASTDLEVIVIRPTLVYGPGAPGNWAQLMRLVASGMPLPFASIDNRRSFVALDNLVDLIVRCVDLENAPTEPLAASDAVPISTPALIRRIASALGRRARMFPCPPRVLLAGARLVGRGAQMHKLVDSLIVDSSRTTELTGWAPRDRLDETLRACAAQYR